MTALVRFKRTSNRFPFTAALHLKCSISAIANLPVAPFVGAASQGWGHYFNGSGTKKPQRRSSDAGATQQIRQRNKRARPPGKRSALSVATGTGGRGLKRPPEWRARSTGQQRLPPPLPPETMEAKVCRSRNAPPECTKVDNGGRFGRRTHSTGNDHCGRRRKKSIDGLADSRARAAIRAAEEEITQRLAVRLQILWDELKVPKPDRAYIVAMYLRQGEGVENEGWPKDTGSSSADMVEQQRSVGEIHHELVRQISLLLEHRAATIEVNNDSLCHSVASNHYPATAKTPEGLFSPVDELLQFACRVVHDTSLPCVLVYRAPFVPHHPCAVSLYYSLPPAIKLCSQFAPNGYR